MWDVALKFTKSSLQLIHDIDMLYDLEEVIRRGITFTNMHHIDPNNLEMGEDYGPETPEYSVVPVDANNL